LGRELCAATARGDRTVIALAARAVTVREVRDERFFGAAARGVDLSRDTMRVFCHA
jgi:hypothetical protein